MKPINYLAVFIFSLLLLSTITIVVNYKIDPYLIFNSPRVDNLNKYKVDINSHIRISKAYHPTYYSWDALIIGNSRIEMGLDPEHRCFTENKLRVYNIGIPGAGVREQLEYALNLIHEQPIKQVFLSVDFLDFLVRNTESDRIHMIDWSKSQINKRLRYSFDGTLNPEWYIESFWDKYRSLFSLDALSSSFKTIMMQSPNKADRTQNGFNPANDFRSSTSSEGVNALFKQKMNFLDHMYSDDWGLYYKGGSRSTAFLALEKFLTITKMRGIQVTIFTNPFHKQFWDLLKRKNLYDEHEEWLGLVLRILKSLNYSNIHFWNFSGDSTYIHEPLPESDNKHKPLKWFWEPSHYRKELGNLMIESMLHAQCGKLIKFGEEILNSE